MDRIEFAHIEGGLYEIIEENDERLLCIGQLLFDDNLREAVHHTLKYAPELGVEKHKEFETQLYKVRLSPDPVYGLLIKLVSKNEPNQVLETDIKISTLLDLIDAWEDAIGQEPETIILTRSQDTFKLTTE